MKISKPLAAACGVLFAAACTTTNTNDTSSSSSSSGAASGGASSGAVSVGSSAGGSTSRPGSSSRASSGGGSSVMGSSSRASSSVGGTSAVGSSSAAGSSSVGATSVAGSSSVGASSVGATSVAGSSSVGATSVAGSSSVGGTSVAGSSSVGASSVGGSSSAAGSSGVAPQAPDCSAPSGAVPNLGLQLVAGGLNAPVLAKAAPGDDTRLYIVNQAGTIALVKNGTLLGTPFLDVNAISRFSGEQGLLGLAFHPDYASNGRFFIYYTANNSHQIVAEYARSAGNADVADAAAVHILLDLDDPASNHNGGTMEFGPDGYLYIGTGDGGGAGDMFGTFGNGQNLASLWGKVLRVDVNNAPNAPFYTIPAGNMTTVPAGNPSASVLEEIWDFGLRNPWRMSFDACTGDLFIADVGQNTYEEINFEPAGMGNRNYCWRLREGMHNFNVQSYPTNLCTEPVLEYSHNNGRCSVSGGYVFRSSSIPGLRGAYFYGDYCTGEVWYTTHNGNTFTTPVNVDFGPTSAGNVSGFGTDNAGNVYVCDLNGSVYRIVTR